MGRTLKRYKNLGKIAFLITLIFPIKDKKIEDHCVNNSVTYFSNGGKLAEYKLVILAVSWIPRYGSQCGIHAKGSEFLAS